MEAAPDLETGRAGGRGGGVRVFCAEKNEKTFGGSESPCKPFSDVEQFLPCQKENEYNRAGGYHFSTVAMGRGQCPFWICPCRVWQKG